MRLKKNCGRILLVRVIDFLLNLERKQEKIKQLKESRLLDENYCSTICTCLPKEIFTKNNKNLEVVTFCFVSFRNKLQFLNWFKVSFKSTIAARFDFIKKNLIAIEHHHRSSNLCVSNVKETLNKP